MAEGTAYLAEKIRYLAETALYLPETGNAAVVEAATRGDIYALQKYQQIWC